MPKRARIHVTDLKFYVGRIAESVQVVQADIAQLTDPTAKANLQKTLDDLMSQLDSTVGEARHAEPVLSPTM